MAAPKKYPDELRERAVRLAVDARRDPESSTGAIQRIAGQLGIHPEALRVWVRKAETDAGQRPGTTSAEAQRIVELERENRELRRANGILKSASAFFAAELDRPLPLIVDYIDQHKDKFGVEPICAVLSEAEVPIAPSTYYARKSRPPSPRTVRDEKVTERIKEVHTQNYGVYGVRKIHAALLRAGGVDDRPVARCTVHRLMKAADLKGISRRKTPRTTVPAKGKDTRPDLVKRDFTAGAPNRLWVADFTYVRTISGWVYAAFVLDVHSRRIVGWQLSENMRTDLALDALQMALWTRQKDGHDLSHLIHHSDRGVQYVDVRYTTRLAEADAVASVGSKGDSYDNAMAEALNSLYKAEMIRNLGPWNGIYDLELATVEYVDWYNHRRLHSEIGYIPPVEHETNYYNTTPAPAEPISV